MLSVRVGHVPDHIATFIEQAGIRDLDQPIILNVDSIGGQAPMCQVGAVEIIQGHRTAVDDTPQLSLTEIVPTPLPLRDFFRQSPERILYNSIDFVNIAAEGVLTSAVDLFDCQDVLVVDSLLPIQFLDAGLEALVGVEHEAFQAELVAGLQLLQESEILMTLLYDFVLLFKLHGGG